MEAIVLKVSTEGDNFLDFYGPLARSLSGVGGVYTPHPVVEPHERAAIPAPSHVLVTLQSLSGFSILYQAVQTYLDRFQQDALILEHGPRKIRIGGDERPGEYGVLRALFPGAING